MLPLLPLLPMWWRLWHNTRGANEGPDDTPFVAADAGHSKELESHAAASVALEADVAAAIRCSKNGVCMNSYVGYYLSTSLSYYYSKYYTLEYRIL